MAAPAKKSTTRAKKAATKKPTSVAVKRSASAAKKAPAMRSLRLAKSDRPFLSFTLTIDTLYWLILSGVILVLGLWIVFLNFRVQQIYDQIDLNTQLQQNMQIVKPKTDTVK